MGRRGRPSRRDRTILAGLRLMATWRLALQSSTDGDAICQNISLWKHTILQLSAASHAS